MATTIVLSIDAEVTRPSRTLRALRELVSVVSAPAASTASAVSVASTSLISVALLGGDLAGPDLGVDAGDLTPRPRDLGGVVELSGGVAEPQVEGCVLGFAELVGQFGE